MRFFKIALIAISFTLCSNLNAQKGKNGNLVVSSTVIVNEYTTLTANATSGSTSITVSNSSLNSHSRFSASLAAGDLVMIIQLQGATINGIPNPLSPSIAKPNDSSWGAVTNYNNCGNNEIREVSSVPNSTTIDLACPLTNNYTSSGVVQIIRIPRLNKLTVNSGGTISCDPWNGSIGGITAIEVDSNTIINTGGQINASGNGFRGAQLVNGGINYGATDFSTTNQIGAEKGEGIAGYQAAYNVYGGMYGRGSAANAGGGGDGVNAAGGGGSNAGIISDWTNGDGIPDTSTANNIIAWKLEYSWLPKSSHSGGGRGGYTWSNDTQNPLTDPLGNSSWSGDDRRSVGGRGGRPLDYSSGRLFLGGGGGAGDENNNNGGAGGNGGGIIYLISYGTISGGGSILSNGNNGGGDANYYGDGAGGGGGGGTILINSVKNISGINISAKGGSGGSQTFPASDNEAEGPGGGGGGGYIATTITSSVTETVTGGNNGTTLSFPTFPPNGATKGANGLIDTLYGPDIAIKLKDSSFCQGDSAYFQASVSLYTGNGSVKWKWAFPGGNPSNSVLQNPAVSYSSSGTYTVTLIDSACSGQDTVSKIIHITVVLAPSVTLSGKDSICKGSPTLLTASGGGTYLWSTGAITSSITVSPSLTTTYTLGVSKSGCVKDTSIKVIVSPAPSITLSGITTLCPGNSTIITSTGGGTYLWNTGSTNDSINVKPISTTTYTLGVTSKGCTKDTSITVTVNPKPVLTINPLSPGECPGVGVNITASGAFSYTWSPSTGLSCTSCSNTVATIFSAQTYTVIGTSLAGCRDTITVMVNVASPPSVTLSGTDSVCKGTATTLTATGGGTYLWSTGVTTSSITVNPSVTVTYTVGVSNGVCTKDTSVKVTVNPIPIISLSGIKSLCPGNGTIISATGGGTYQWSDGSTNDTINVSPTSTSTYTLGVTDKGCVKDTSVVVTINPKPNVTVTPPSASICKGTGTPLLANGAVTYSWSPSVSLSCTTCSNPTADPASSETYSVIGTSTAGCKDTVSVPITVNPVPIATISGKDTICLGNSTTLNASGGGTYSWNTGSSSSSILVSPIVTTTYTITVSNGFCTKDTTNVVTVLPPFSVKVTGDSACKGIGSIITASGGTSYKWLPGGATTSSISVAPPVSTTYSVIISGPCGTDTLSALVFVEPIPVIKVSGNDSVCSGTNTVLSASGANTYVWSTGNTNSSITVAPASTITYTVTGSNGKCHGDTTITVKVTPKPTATIAGLNKVCKGDSITLTATGGGSYIWSNNTTGNSITIAPSKDTTVYVVVTKGCADTAYHTITIPATKGVTACCDTTIGPGGTAVLNANGVVGYVWSPSGNVDCYTCAKTTATPGSNTTYTITGTDSNGCVSTATIIVDIGCFDFFVPNVFTPNNDNINDLFVIHAEYEPTYSIEIYDRWGVKMFSSTNPSDYWNGKINNTGAKVPDGVYYYIIKAECGGKDYNHNGFVQVIR